MLKDQRESICASAYRIVNLTLPGKIDVLLLLYNEDDYVSLDEIYKRTGHRFRNKSHFLSSLREELIEGVIEKRLERDSSFYKITSKGRNVVERFSELSKLLES